MSPTRRPPPGAHDLDLARLRRLTIPDLASFPHEPRERRHSLHERVLRAFETKASAAGLDDIQLRRVLRRLLITEVPAGRFVITPGDTPDFMSVVGSGCVKTMILPPVLDPLEREKRLLTVQFAGPSYVFGLNPITGTSPGQFGAIAHVDSVVVAISRDVMRDLLEQTPPEGRLRLVAYHARALSRLIFDKCRLLALPIRDRLRLELQNLAHCFPDEANPCRIALPLTHQDLAELIGATRFAVMRTLAAMQDEVSVARFQYTISPELAGVVRRDAAPHTATRPQRRMDTAAQRRFAHVLSWARDQLGLPKRVVDVLARGATLASYDSGQRIDAALDPNDDPAVAVLISGAARVMVDTGVTGPVGAWIAKPGHFIGVGWGPRADHARAFWSVALTPCDVAMLSPAVMTTLLGTLSAEQLLGFLGVCHEALSRQLYDRCAMLSLTTVERLLYQLHRLAEDFPEDVSDGSRIKIPLRLAQDVAPLIGSDRSAASRALSALSMAGHVRVDGDRIVVRAAPPRSH